MTVSGPNTLTFIWELTRKNLLHFREAIWLTETHYICDKVDSRVFIYLLDSYTLIEDKYIIFIRIESKIFVACVFPNDLNFWHHIHSRKRWDISYAEGPVQDSQHLSLVLIIFLLSINHAISKSRIKYRRILVPGSQCCLGNNFSFKQCMLHCTVEKIVHLQIKHD